MRTDCIWSGIFLMISREKTLPILCNCLILTTFTTVLYEESNLHSPMITMPVQLEPGKYYIRVKATNESGREQYAFDTYMAEEGKQYGIKCFYYLEDGSIVEDGANDE